MNNNKKNQKNKKNKKYITNINTIKLQLRIKNEISH